MNNIDGELALKLKKHEGSLEERLIFIEDVLAQVVRTIGLHVAAQNREHLQFDKRAKMSDNASKADYYLQSHEGYLENRLKAVETLLDTTLWNMHVMNININSHHTTAPAPVPVPVPSPLLLLLLLQADMSELATFIEAHTGYFEQRLMIAERTLSNMIQNVEMMHAECVVLDGLHVNDSFKDWHF